jgi:predicted aspartyl protease
MSSGQGWSRRSLGAALGASALAPALLSACASPRQLVSINLLDTEATKTIAAPTPAPDGVAKLEAAFDDAKRMVVPVFINGRGPFGFVVDTGASRSVVASELVETCGLTSAGTADVHGIAGVEPANMATVRHLSVGSVSSSGLVMPTLPRARLGADGLLGVDILHGRSMLLNFAQNRFEISNGGQGAEIGRDSNSRIPNRVDPIHVAATYRNGQLVILDAQVGETPVSAFLDSGSQVTVGNLALRDAVVRTIPDFGVRLAPVPLISATGQTAFGQFAPLPTVRLGGMAVHDVMGIFAQLHIFDLWKLNDRPAILIGIDVLRHFHDVTLDFSRRQVVFTPALPGERPGRARDR